MDSYITSIVWDNGEMVTDFIYRATSYNAAGSYSMKAFEKRLKKVYGMSLEDAGISDIFTDKVKSGFFNERMRKVKNGE